MSDVSRLRKATLLESATLARNIGSIRYIDGELALCNGTNWTYPQREEATFYGGTSDSAFYVATRPMEVVAIKEVHSTAGSDGSAVTMFVTKDIGVTTPGGDSAGAATTTTPGDTGVDEVQSIAPFINTVTGGTYTLTLNVNGGGAVTTAAIAYNANAAAVQAAIDLVSGVTAGHIVVTGGPLTTTALTITFSGDDVDETNQAQTTINGNNLTLANSVPVQTGTFNMKGTANTVQSATLTSTTANKKLAVGDRLSVNFRGTTTALAGVVTTVTMRPI